MGRGDRVPHRGRPHHRRQAAGVHPAVRRARRLHADDHDQQRGLRRRDRGDRVRAVLRRGLARDRRSAATSPSAPPGEPCWVEGTVTDTDGKPVPGARIEVWEADEDGLYDVQYDDDRSAGPGHLVHRRRGPATGSGRSRPTPYPIPHDGPVGEMLAAVGRSPHARLAPALHGHAPRAAHPGHPHLRPRRRAPRPRHRVRRQGLADQATSSSSPPARRPPTAATSTAVPGPGPLRHRPRSRTGQESCA